MTATITVAMITAAGIVTGPAKAGTQVLIAEHAGDAATEIISQDGVFGAYDSKKQED